MYAIIIKLIRQVDEEQRLRREALSGKLEHNTAPMTDAQVLQRFNELIKEHNAQPHQKTPGDS